MSSRTHPTQPPATLQEEIGKRHPFEVPEEEAYLNILRTQSVLGRESEQLLAGYGLSESTYNALRILRGAGLGGCSCTEIREDLVAQVPDVTRIVDRLEQAGLAERCRTPEDRRVVLVKITQKGLDLLAQLDGPTKELARAQLGHLSRAELAELNRLLVKARHRNT